MAWRRCSTCKKDVNHSTKYQICSVSTCRKWVFCSVDCWDTHNSVMSHRSGWAEEHTSPDNQPDDLRDGPNVRDKPRRRIVAKSNSSSGVIPKGDFPRDVLVVASKLKAYVKAKHDMNTSGNVLERLSDIMRVVCDDAVEQARIEGRKTLMDRDFK